MDNDDRPNPTLESLLREMIANQHSIDETLRELYEKVVHLEQKLETAESSLEWNEEDDNDELYEQAVEIVRKHGKASTSFLQRSLRIGYSRAARLIDLLEERGVIGTGAGATPRQVLTAEADAGDDDDEPTKKTKATIHGD